MSGANCYDVYFGTDYYNPPYKEQVSSSYFSISNLGVLEYNQVYHWKVVAKHEDSSSSVEIAHSGLWSFITEGTPTTPEKPTNPSPRNNASDVSIHTNLDWVDVSGTTSYDVYFGTGYSSVSSYSSSVHKGQVSTSYLSNNKFGPLKYNQKYYWKVVAKNSAGSQEGDVWQFTTESAPNELISISITGNDEIKENSYANYTAKAHFSNAPDKDVTTLASWSENSSYASIDLKGRLTTNEVSSNKSLTVKVSYTYNNVTRKDSKVVTIKDIASSSFSGGSSTGSSSSGNYSGSYYGGLSLPFNSGMFGAPTGYGSFSCALSKCHH